MTNWYDEDDNAMIVYMSLPVGVNECVCLNEDGSYTIVINDRICEEKRMKAFHHALFHIHHDDFHRSDVQDIERNAHK